MDTKQIISIISDLQIDQRSEIADQILPALHLQYLDREKVWVVESRSRLESYQAGKVMLVSEPEVIRFLRDCLSK